MSSREFPARSCALRLWTAIACLLSAVNGPLAASEIQPVAQDRSLMVITNAVAGEVQNNDTDSALAPDLGLFDESLESSSEAEAPDGQGGDPLWASGGALAEQRSSIAPNRIHAVGRVGCTATTDGQGTFAEGDAHSETEFLFFLPSAGKVRVTGTINSFDFGQVRVDELRR